MASIILFSILVILIYMTIWWLFALYQGRNDVADIAWGLGFITLSIALSIRYSQDNPKTYLLISMIVLWGTRLALHIAMRHSGKPEDGRYQKMREKWKRPALQSYLNVFISQGFFLLLVATPIILYFSNKSTTELQWYNILGLIVWIIGFSFETISDYQLTKYIKSPQNKGKIMRYGLWSYSRHPNYFGEISLWWGFYIFTLFTPFWSMGLIGPITITILILGISGIPMLEKRYEGNKEYENYKKTTSAFFPIKRKA